MLHRNGNYYTFSSSNGSIIPDKYRIVLVKSCVKLKLWYVVGYNKKYVKVRIMPVKGDFKGVSKILCKLKASLNAIV